MEKHKHKIVVAVTGASGSIYAKNLLSRIQSLSAQVEDLGLIFSDNAKDIWEYELGNKDFETLPYRIFDRRDFSAPFASGSAKYNTMIVCPCSMGAIGRIANGISDDLISRAADVILKERRKLILVTRDTPLSMIHIDNMRKITEVGGIVCPAVPSFYSKPQTIDDLVNTVVDRVIDLAGLELKTYRWGNEELKNRG